MEKSMKKNMKYIAAAGLTALSLTACRKSGGGIFSPEVKTGTKSTYAYLLDTTELKKPELDLENAAGDLKKVLDKKVFTIVTSADFPPGEWLDSEGEIRGSEMMLAKYIADCLGVDLEIRQSDFSGTFAAVDAGEADCAFAGYGWTKDREEKYGITEAYIGENNEAETYCTVIVLDENVDKYTAFEDLADARIMVQADSLQAAYCDDQLTGSEIIKTGSLDQAIQGLEYDKCDAVVLNGTTAENYVKQSDGKFILTGIKIDLSAYEDKKGNIGICLKGDGSLLNVINACIKTAKENGYYEKWYQDEKEIAVWKNDFPEPEETPDEAGDSEETDSQEDTEN